MSELPSTRIADTKEVFQKLRDSVPRKAGGLFGKGNKNAAGRKTGNYKQSNPFRQIQLATSPADFAEIWAGCIVDAKAGCHKSRKLVCEALCGNRLVLEQQEEIDELRASVEVWIIENPSLIENNNGSPLDPVAKTFELVEEKRLSDEPDEAPK